MTNIERLTARLNAHGCRRSIYNALFGLVASTPPDNPRIALLEAVKKGAKKDE